MKTVILLLGQPKKPAKPKLRDMRAFWRKLRRIAAVGIGVAGVLLALAVYFFSDKPDAAPQAAVTGLMIAVGLWAD